MINGDGLEMLFVPVVIIVDLIEKYRQTIPVDIREAIVNGKQITIKSSVDLDYLKKFADKWKIDNKYNT